MARINRPRLIASALLHAAVLILAIGVIHETPPVEPLPEQGIAVVFERGARQGSPAPSKAHPEQRPSAPPQPATQPPTPEAAPAAPPAPGPLAMQTAPPPPGVPSVPQTFSVPTQPPPPAPEPLVSQRPPPLPAAPRAPQALAVPASPPPPAPGPLALQEAPPPTAPAAPRALPVPPPPQVRLPAPELPAAPPLPVPPLPVPAPRLAAPSRPRPGRPSFPAPMDLSLARPSPGSRAAPRSRGLDLSMGPVVQGGHIMAPRADFDAKAAGTDWEGALMAWVDRHKYYPQRAALAGEDGSATVLVTMQHDGRVQSVELETSSGSEWLDIATLGMFRDAMLPALPVGMRQREFTFHFTMHYILARGSG